MFTCAIITGVKSGWLKEKCYSVTARKGWLALTIYLNEEDNLTEICGRTA